jgi:hypothetical protein
VPGTDVLVVSVDSTSGWRASARELTESMKRAGARVELVETGPLPRVRTFMLTDLLEARAARQAALRGIAAHDPTAIVYCSITAALLWPRPGAIWLDSIAAQNRPGRHGVWQRPVERRRLGASPLILAMSERALQPLPDDAVVVHVPVEPSGPAPATRDIAAITYAGGPGKRRLGLVLDDWSRVARPGETLVVAGLDGIEPAEGIKPAGRLSPVEYRTLLRRSRVFVAAPRREDYGIAPLEALVDGCQLVTTPALGPYPALELARALDPRLVADDLRAPLRLALDDPLDGYAERAQELLAPFRREAVDRTIADHVLPRLL